MIVDCKPQSHRQGGKFDQNSAPRSAPRLGWHRAVSCGEFSVNLQEPCRLSGGRTQLADRSNGPYTLNEVFRPLFHR